MREMGPLSTSMTSTANVTFKTFPAPNAVKKTCVYDALNRRIFSDTSKGAQLIQRCTISYDHRGNVRKLDEQYPTAPVAGKANRTVLNLYDRSDRLHQEIITTSGNTKTTEYRYDKANNRTEKHVGGQLNRAYTYNAGNQLTLIEDGSPTNLFTFSYDSNGNRTQRTRQTPSQTDTYTYDIENRLIRLVKNTTDGGEVGDYDYEYDYRTRRVQRETETAAHVEVSFDGGTSVEEHAGTARTENSLTAQYVRGSGYGGGVGSMLYSIRNTVLSFSHENGRGDVTSRTNVSGTLTWQAHYEAFGLRDGSDVGAASNADPHRANTKEEDPTRLLCEGFRYRDLHAGVFITRDPAGFVDGPNLYTYVNQNPWTHFDPHGLSSTSYWKNLGKFWGSVVGRPAQLGRAAINSLTPPSISSGKANFVGDMKWAAGMNPITASLVDPIEDAVDLATGDASVADIKARRVDVPLAELRAATERKLTTPEGLGELAADGAMVALTRKALGKNPAGPSARDTGPKSGHFPHTADELSDMMGVPPKKVGTTPDGTPRTTWEPNSSTRIRHESHPHGLTPGDPGYNPRHHGEHFHVETKPADMSWNQAKKKGQVQKQKPEGYTPGSGTGFLPDEKFPGTTH